jgi:hypothetical protein
MVIAAHWIVGIASAAWSIEPKHEWFESVDLAGQGKKNIPCHETESHAVNNSVRDCPNAALFHFMESPFTLVNMSKRRRVPASPCAVSKSFLCPEVFMV